MLPRVLLLALALLAAGCAQAQPPTGAGGIDVPGIDVPRIDVPGAVAAAQDGAPLIDVRTPEEFAAGHVEGAQNIDFSAPDFATRVQALDPATEYVVYCQSGNRSTKAIAAMTALGFTDLINGGAVKDLLAAGLPQG